MKGLDCQFAVVMSVWGAKPEKLSASICFPLFTQQRTLPRYFGMSVRCHEATFESAPSPKCEQPRECCGQLTSTRKR